MKRDQTKFTKPNVLHDLFFKIVLFKKCHPNNSDFLVLNFSRINVHLEMFTGTISRTIQEMYKSWITQTINRSQNLETNTHRKTIFFFCFNKHIFFQSELLECILSLIREDNIRFLSVCLNKIFKHFRNEKDLLTRPKR